MIFGDIEVNFGLMIDNVFDIIYLNIRSIRYKIVYFNILVYDFDILCFIEIYFDDIVLNDSFLFDGFDIIYRKDRNCYGGGVMIYVLNII